MNKETVDKYLQNCGEVMIYTCDEEMFELHQHDTSVNENHILIDKDEEKHVIGYNHICSLDVHESGRE